MNDKGTKVDYSLNGDRLNEQYFGAIHDGLTPDPRKVT